jgi:catechol 2,3-dioxygenase-like lactoylglutathione lyase family enzyme
MPCTSPQAPQERQRARAVNANFEACDAGAIAEAREAAMLGSATVTALVGTMKPEAAKAFYADTLGLKFINDDGYAQVFEGKNARVRVSRVPAVMPAQYAVLAFQVDDIDKAVDGLTAKGVVFARYGFFVQDAKGVWTAPDGTKVAWFHDPDLNLLSVVQHV